MHRIIATTLVTTIAATALTVAPAQAASYAVTLTTSKQKVDVGRKFTLSGKVTGKSASAKTLRIQRKVGSGAWSTLTTVKTTSKGSYSRAVTARSTGATAYRVVAPKAGSTAQGTSPSVTVTGYTWLYLADQPVTAVGGAVVDTPRTIGGKTYKKSIVLFGGSSLVAWNFQQQCDQVTSAVTVDPKFSGSNPQSTSTEIGSTSGTLASAVAQLGSASPLAANATGVGYLGFQVDGDDETTSPVDILSPRAHCSTTQLDDEVLL